MKYIIEGVKLAGKSTLADRIRKYSMGSTVIDYRAYTKANPRPYTIHKDMVDRLLSFS